MLENILSVILHLRPYLVEVRFRGCPGDYYCEILHAGFTSCGHGVTLEEAAREAGRNFEQHLKRSE